MKKKKGFYSISVVAKMFSVHQQTIRLYEKEGLINPKRSSGNTRLFSEEDVDRLEKIIYLTHKMGVNLAGIEIIFKLQKKISKLQSEMNKLFEQTQEQIQEENQFLQEDAKKQAAQLLQMKKEAKKDTDPIDVEHASNKKNRSDDETEDWEIDYDER